MSGSAAAHARRRGPQLALHRRLEAPADGEAELGVCGGDGAAVEPPVSEPQRKRRQAASEAGQGDQR